MFDKICAFHLVKKLYTVKNVHVIKKIHTFKKCNLYLKTLHEFKNVLVTFSNCTKVKKMFSYFRKNVPYHLKKLQGAFEKGLTHLKNMSNTSI